MWSHYQLMWTSITICVPNGQIISWFELLQPFVFQCGQTIRQYGCIKPFVISIWLNSKCGFLQLSVGPIWLTIMQFGHMGHFSVVVLIVSHSHDIWTSTTMCWINNIKLTCDFDFCNRFVSNMIKLFGLVQCPLNWGLFVFKYVA